MIESITAAGRTDSHRRPRKKKPNPCVPSQPLLNPCGSPPAHACTHTQGWLGSPRRPARRGAEASGGEERREEASGLPRQLPGISCLCLCCGRSLPVRTGQKPPRLQARANASHSASLPRRGFARTSCCPSSESDSSGQPEGFLDVLVQSRQRFAARKLLLAKMCRFWLRVRKTKGSRKFPKI